MCATVTYRHIGEQERQDILTMTGTHREIAEQLGVHKDTVGRIRRQQGYENANQFTGIERPLARSKQSTQT